MIEWYSLTQICEDAKFFADGPESNDVVQGSLGNCCFVSALSVLATKDYLLRGEFSPNILDDGEIDDEENVMLSTGVYPPIFHSFRKKDEYQQFVERLNYYYFAIIATVIAFLYNIVDAVRGLSLKYDDDKKDKPNIVYTAISFVTETLIIPIYLVSFSFNVTKKVL